MKVQIIHIDGPFKGEIQEFEEEKITIGRHPSCSISFPPDLRVVSRQHAHILREGNRFKLVDHSTNGTLVNGKPVKETYLKSGDVITFAEGGPKVSFLLVPGEGLLPPLGSPSTSTTPTEVKVPPTPPPFPEPPGISPAPPGKVKAPLIIQFGPVLKDFEELPVKLGRSPECEMVIDHPAVASCHLEIYFSGGEYYVRALEGPVYVNGQPVKEKILQPQDELALSPQGPRFRFLGQGRLAEVLEEESPTEPPPQEPFSPPPSSPEPPSEGKWSFLKKFLKK